MHGIVHQRDSKESDNIIKNVKPKDARESNTESASSGHL